MDLAVQLQGIARVLGDVVAPEVADDYAADVLRGLVATIELLAAGADEITPFLRWDIEATEAVLALVKEPGSPSPPVPLPLDDPEALAARQREVRARLVAVIDRVRADPTASAAAAALFRSRAERFPFAPRVRRDP